MSGKICLKNRIYPNQTIPHTLTIRHGRLRTTASSVFNSLRETFLSWTNDKIMIFCLLFMIKPALRRYQECFLV